MIGTFILVFFGVGSVHAAVLMGAYSGLFQVAMIWAFAVTLAIYTTAAVSGAHLNPAVTIAMSIFRGFPKRSIIPFIIAQVLGAFLAAAVLNGLFSGLLAHFESVNGLVRGQPGSELAAMIFGEYFPNPGMTKAGGWPVTAVSEWQAMGAEAIGTMFLVLFICALTDAKNKTNAGALVPLFIGLAVGIIICIVAPLTQAGLNPARDFGPRLYSYLIGYGSVAIPGPRGGFFTVYILAPIIGGIVGAAIWENPFRTRPTWRAEWLYRRASDNEKN